MQDLSNLFKDLFEDPKITNNRLVTYGTDQISRLVNNNPAAVYATIITETNATVAVLNDIVVERESSISTREGSTVTKNATQINLTEYISQQEGLVKSVFGKDSGQYQEFFPKGLSAFHQGTDMEYDNATKVVMEKAIKYETELGSTFKTKITVLYDAWHKAYTTQGTDTVTADNDGTEEKTAATALRLQLTKNALFIAFNNVGIDAAFDTYFDTTLLFAQHRTHFYKGVAAANSTSVVHDITYSAGKHLHMKNKGAVDITFQMWLGNTPVGNNYTVQPGKVVDKSFAEFFSNGDSLRVTNASTTTESAYEVREVA